MSVGGGDVSFIFCSSPQQRFLYTLLLLTALTTMLAAFLTGIALGGYGIRFLLKPDLDRAVIFGWVQVLLGIFSALALPMLFGASDPQSLNQYVLRTSDDAVALTLTQFLSLVCRAPVQRCLSRFWKVTQWSMEHQN